MLDYFSNSQITYTHAEETVPLALKGSDKSIPLDELVKSVVPECKLHPMLFNGHLQTAIRSGDTHVHYKRRIFESENARYPGQFAVDFIVHPQTPPERDPKLPPRTHNFTEDEWTEFCAHPEDTRPLLICMHGLSGGSHEQYVRHMLEPATRQGSGWTACVINARGCAWSKLSTPVLFNARATWDIRQFVIFLRKKFPKRKFFGVGFSLGANVMTNYIGEEGDKCEFSAAVIVGNPWNLDVANAMLRTTWVGANVYLVAMAAGLKKLFERHIEVIQKNDKIDVDKVRNAKYLYEWDRYVQCPSWGYPTEDAYYRDASSVNPAFNVRIPVLALHARDDPIINDMAVPYGMFRVTPYWVMVATANGGHLGWYEYGGDRWSNRAIVGFLHKFAAEVEGLGSPIPVLPEAKDNETDGLGNKSTWDPIAGRYVLS